MPRAPRKVSPSGFYHVIVRGAGRRLLFEDDYDRRFFLSKLYKYTKECNVSLLSWCLMENHVHLLVDAGIGDLESLMRSLDTSFARFFNGRHGHVGPVFQDRYKSIPVATDPQLLQTMRYIHKNPQEACICNCDEYKWSSYLTYLVGSSHLDSTLILELLGGKGGFIAFHRNADEHENPIVHASMDSFSLSKCFIVSDEQAVEIAKGLYGEGFANSVASLPKVERDAAVSQLRSMGLSVRQVERLTGIGRGIVQHCSPR